MSIKLSIKELKDLLKLNKLAIKKRKRSKKRLGKAIQNQNIRSTSAHMISSGTTMMNTANEQGELIRLQRQALEDKLKDDKENRIKKEVKEKEAKEQNDFDNAGGMVPYSRLSGNGGSNALRDEVRGISKTVNYMMMMPGTYLMPAQGRPAEENRNVGFGDEPIIEEVESEKEPVFAGDDEAEEVREEIAPKEEAKPKVKTAMLGKPKVNIGVLGKPKVSTGVLGKPKVSTGVKTPATEPVKTRAKTKEDTLKETRALYREVTEEPFFNKANATSEKQKSSSEEPKKKGFDPDTLQISTLNVPQLIGWINNQRGSTDDKLLELSRPELMAIAKKIKRDNAIK